ncbi:NAD(+) synthase [uncultured Veillonella sp.]|uniref:NAD(+) synthase n=1 Tax=uncultured Veillonella sp. TaxID=159268 RepID=UPI0026064610|nr:NAD(+) synthase [uncultured Veillonella sp.]
MIRIGMGQIEIVPGNPRKNKETILKAMQYANALRIDVLVLPELALSGYLIGDLWEQPAFVKECLNFGEDIIKATDSMALIFGNVGLDPKTHNYDGRARKFNAIYCAQHGKLIKPSHGHYPFFIKTLSPNYRFFNEARYFTDLQTLAFEKQTSIEDLLSLLTIKGPNDEAITIAPLLCEDSWDDNYPLSPTELLYKKSQDCKTPIQAYINISASPFTLGKNERRHRLFQERAKTLKTPIVYINSVGLQNNGKSICTFDGQSTYYDTKGQIKEQLPAFEPTIKAIRLPLKEDTTEQLKREESIQSVYHDAVYLSQDKQSDVNETTSIVNTSLTYNESEQIYKALNYGLTTFLHQTGIKKVVIGVSGGIDSALNAALYAHILGPANVYLVNMPSRFNSDTTKDLAHDLAKNLGCPYAVCPVETSLELTTKQLSELIFISDSKNEVLHITPFIKENIQARDRSSRILAGIAAAIGGAFTCNGNKTELSIGYATLYGDMAGFLAATGDLWKHQVYSLAIYLNEKIYKRQVIPQGSIDIIPSAELSDQQDITKGQGDPLQYEYHDRLFQSFIEPWNRLTPEDILQAYVAGTLETVLNLPQSIDHYFNSAQEFIDDLERWWRLQSGMAVAKRIQSPPIIVVSRRAYGNDLQESQMTPYYTETYLKLKEEILAKTI